MGSAGIDRRRRRVGKERPHGFLEGTRDALVGRGRAGWLDDDIFGGQRFEPLLGERVFDRSVPAGEGAESLHRCALGQIGRAHV